MKNHFSKPLKSENKSAEKTFQNVLVLHNDDVNTFDYVICCLIEICEHDYVQAEQCAMLTHFKGKCEIKQGENKSLKKMKKSLTDNGLLVTME